MSVPPLHVCVRIRTGVLLLALALPQTLFGQDRATNATAFARLRQAVERDYSYRDRLNIDWDKRLAEFQPRFLAAASKGEFERVTVEFLGAAKDVHIWLKDGTRTVGTYQMDLRPNFNPRLLPKYLAQFKQHGKTVVTGRFADRIRYVAIGTWDARDPAATEAAVAAVKEAATAKVPVILDVRPNTGGAELTARRVAAFFVTNPVVYAKHISHSAGRDGPIQERMVGPDASGVRHPGPCVVLMGPANISSCEAFLLMMRAAGCPLIGSRSQGASGNPMPHDLGNGLVVMLPSWRSLGLDGKELEGVGITPDITVQAAPGDFTMKDPVLEKVLEHLRR